MNLLAKIILTSIPFCTIKDCQILVYLNFMAGMMQRFISAKRLIRIRYFSNSSKLIEHRTQSPVHEIKMLAVSRKVSDESLGQDEMLRHTSHEI